MDKNKRLEEKNYFSYTTKEGLVWGRQYFELKEVYKEIVDESIIWITNNFTHKTFQNEYLDGEEKIVFFEGDRQEFKEKLRNSLIFENMGKFLKCNKIGTLVEYKEENVQMDKARDC